MLIGYNLTNIATDVLFVKMKEKTKDKANIYWYCLENVSSCPTKELQASTILTCSGLLLFNVSHWMFAHRYF